jgi:hypothetical protein
VPLGERLRWVGRRQAPAGRATLEGSARPPPHDDGRGADGRAPPAAAPASPGDEFDRRPGAKAFGRGAKGGGGGSSSSEGEEDEGESDYEEEEEGAGLPQLDSDDLIAEADSGAGRLGVGSGPVGARSRRVAAGVAEGPAADENARLSHPADDEEEDESDEDAPPEEQKSKVRGAPRGVEWCGGRHRRAPPCRRSRWPRAERPLNAPRRPRCTSYTSCPRQAKRTIPISTPQPAKKAKQEDAKAPASAPPKVQQKAATGGGKQQKGGSPGAACAGRLEGARAGPGPGLTRGRPAKQPPGS